MAIGTGAAVASILTHGMVSSGMHLNEPLPISPYQGFFRYVLLATERLWSYAHGWQSMSHIDEFGRFYAQTVHLICPLIGFALYWVISRHKVGINFWKPVAIAFISASPLCLETVVPLLKLGLGVLWSEMACTLLIVLSMVLSVRAFRKSQAPAAGSLATA
jgi:hypothetical protein